MNIFHLERNVIDCAQAHCDKHVVKMILEYAQLLSTSLRMCDGVETVATDPDGKSHTKLLLDGESIGFKPKINGGYKAYIVNPVCYELTHKNHPCAVWARQTNNNYIWLWCLFQAVSHEYTYRYGKVHLTWEKLREALMRPPMRIDIGYLWPLPQCVPEQYKRSDSIEAYRQYYIEGKADLLTYTKREVPSWIPEGLACQK